VISEKGQEQFVWSFLVNKSRKEWPLIDRQSTNGLCCKREKQTEQLQEHLGHFKQALDPLLMRNISSSVLLVVVECEVDKQTLLYKQEHT